MNVTPVPAASRSHPVLAGLGSPRGSDFRESWKRDPNSEYELPVDTWSTSRERDAYLSRRRFLLVPWLLAVVCFLLGWALIRPAEVSPATWAGYGALGAGLALLLWSMIPYLASKAAYRQRRKATAAARVDDALRQLSSSDPARPDMIDFARLYQLNRRQLDQYQQLTQKQQRTSFYLSQAATTVAFLALLAGVVMALELDDDTEKLLGAGLSGLGALLSTFLANTFYKAHQSANDLLGLYYEEPQRMGTFLAAERLARSLNEPPGSDFAKKLVTAVLRAEAARKDSGGTAPGSQTTKGARVHKTSAPSHERRPAAPTGEDPSSPPR